MLLVANGSYTHPSDPLCTQATTIGMSCCTENASIAFLDCSLVETKFSGHVALSTANVQSCQETSLPQPPTPLSSSIVIDKVRFSVGMISYVLDRRHDPSRPSYPLTSAFVVFCTCATTTSTTLLNPSISSSTVPPIPALAKLIELPTYTGLPVLRASNLAILVVNSNVDS